MHSPLAGRLFVRESTDPGAMPAGLHRGVQHKLGEMLPEYYELRGWTAEGEPTREKLDSLGL